MTRAQLISEVAAKTGLKHKDAEAAVSAVFDTMISVLSEGEKVQIAGFGTFTVHERGEHVGRNPYSGESITVPPSRYLSFSLGKTLKENL